MDKVILNMIGGGFQHDICSSGFNVPKYVVWDKSTYSGKISIHIDNAIYDYTPNKSKFNVAWFAESSAIIWDLISSLYHKEYLDYLDENFDLIITHDKRVCNLHPKIKLGITNACPWVRDRRIHPKSKLISMIASRKVMCEGHKYRQVIIEKYKGKVDHWGFGFQNQLERKEDGLVDYMFSIAMENDNYPGCFCEKITDCFATGTIPIYWGNPDIGDWFNTNGIILLDDKFNIDSLTPELYNSKKEYIEDNFKRSIELPTAEDYIYLNYLK